MNWLEAVVYLALLLILAKPLGSFMARVFRGEPTFLTPLLKPVERLLYRAASVDPSEDMPWPKYAAAVMVFNLLGLLAVYGLQRVQNVLPLNPTLMPAVEASSAWNTAVSFASNTNWQGYSGEVTMSYLTQMLGLTVQNFLSAATGIAVFVAFIRGLFLREAKAIGNFWVDATRATLYVLIPLSLVLAVALVSQGVLQTFEAGATVRLLDPTVDATGAVVTHQQLSFFPAASQIAIKQLGTNGGGVWNTNSAHPFENPTPFSNLLENLAILMIPAALCFTFGEMVNDRRQGRAVLAAMTLMFVLLLVPTLLAENAANPILAEIGLVDTAGNMEGKEQRFGASLSALWAVSTTAASNGSVNAMHDSFTPIGGLFPMWAMQLGEVVFGGVGSGLYGLLIFVIVAVFIAGLMVGRTPEYLGKKIEAFEIKMAAIVLLMPVLTVLLGTAIAVLLPAGQAGPLNPGPHGFSEILYAFSSAGNNNGSAFAGISANTAFYNTALGFAMLISRYWLIIPVLAVAGSLAAKKAVSPGAGTLPTHAPLFVLWLIAVVFIVGALSFIPALAIGPIAEQLLLNAGVTF
ncbi:MAG: potassium-transporting ATPase subunit KdpA [Anaerolineales bacterium]|nr:potassium-transporting ATPase subunit KdpA [Anaerolineales bacterium]MCW5838524.1 potassium-transporting ATPase subunit KdpA [Anaerolineales bacterium]